MHKDPLIGYLLDKKYRLERCVGRGGMGAVYLAKQESVNRQVAIKVLLPEMFGINENPNTEILERFRLEAFAAARVEHPNTVSIYDFGKSEEGILYLVMQFLPGKSLRSVLMNEKMFMPTRVVELALQICSGLSAIHKQGIIHRDLKPENIVITDLDGREVPKIIDFGIAKLKDDIQALTKTGVPIGTVTYMSPEQCNASEVDVRSDIYSLGIMLYEMLCGSVPFTGSPSIVVLVQHVMKPPTPLKSVNSEIPNALADLVMCTLEKDPACRPQSVDELRENLHQFLMTKKISVEQPIVDVSAKEVDVFVSYAEPDLSSVYKVIDSLVSAGVKVWMERNFNDDSIVVSSDTDAAIKNCKAMLMMCSNAAMRSRKVKQELQAAWQYNKPCLPLIINKLSFINQLKYWLEGRNSIDILDKPEEKWLSQVKSSLQSLGITFNTYQIAQTPVQNFRGFSPTARLRGLGGVQKQTNSPTNKSEESQKVPSQIPETSPAEVVYPTRFEPGFDGLLTVARFTDQIWPIPFSQSVEANSSRAFRGLGAPQAKVKHNYKVGDNVRLTLEIDRPGYLLLLNKGADKLLYCLCPSWFAPKNKVEPGKHQLPQESSNYKYFEISGESGREQLLAIISDEPFNFDWMPSDPKNPAKILEEDDIRFLLSQLTKMKPNSWIALSTYFEVN